MPTTPSKPSPRRGPTDENPTNAIPLTPRSAAKLPPVAPWSRSKVTRFAGPDSIYKQAAGEPAAAPATPGRTPLKEEKRPSVTLASGGRYATTAERAIERAGTPGGKAPSSGMKSATDRFTLPGGVHETRAGPGVGTYEPSDKATRRRQSVSAVKLQKAIRRRQSRGVFAQGRYDAEGGEVPGPGQYEVSAAPTANHTLVGPSAGFKGGERFVGPASIYAVDTKPSAEAYNPNDRDEATSGMAIASAGMASTTDRFTLPGGVHAPRTGPGVGIFRRNFDPSSAADKAMHSKVVGAVKIQKLIRHRQSRGVFAQVEAHARSTPAPGDYAPPTDVVPRVSMPKPPTRGQRAAAQLLEVMGEAQAQAQAEEPTGPAAEPEPVAEVAAEPVAEPIVEPTAEPEPEPVAEPTPEPVAEVAAAEEVAAMNVVVESSVECGLSEEVAFMAEETEAEAMEAEEEAEWAAADAEEATSPASPTEAAPMSLDLMFGSPSSSSPWDILPASPEEAKEEAEEAEAADADAADAEVAAAMGVDESEVALMTQFGGLLPSMCDGPRYSVGGTAVGVYDDFAERVARFSCGAIQTHRGSPHVDLRTMPTLSEGAQADLADAESSVSGLSVTDDETSQRLSAFSLDESGRTSTFTSGTSGRKSDGMGEDGEWLFSQMSRIMGEGEVDKEDYYCEEEGWDLHGLRSDLQLYMQGGRFSH